MWPAHGKRDGGCRRCVFGRRPQRGSCMAERPCSSIRKKILVVTSDEKRGERLARWLIDAGYHVVRYADFRKLPELTVEEQPDVVVIDVDGLADDECRSVSGQCADNALNRPVLILSSSPDTDAVPGTATCSVDCVQAETDPVELMTRVRAMLRIASDSDDGVSSRKRDTLTKVYNRRYFDERIYMEIERARRYGRKVSCVMVDIDGFKEINSRHGHKAGDDVLKVLADIMLSGTRSSDIVARYGGEEFVVILPEASGREAGISAERLRKAFEDRSLCLGEDKAVTVSCGVATYPDHAADASTLLRMADSAVYKAKEDGANRCVVAFSEEDERLSGDGALSPRILLVEDNDYNRCVASLVLRASGYEVLEATDGEMGVNLAKTSHPDLVIVDLQIHGMSGMETTRKIARLDEIKDIPVVALTVGDVPSELEELARAGCRGYITKPIDTNVLASQVQLYLEE